MAGTSARSRVHSVVLPAPAAAETTNSMPAPAPAVSGAPSAPRRASSLKVLHLLADRLDDRADAQRRLADRKRLRLRGDGVGFAVHFLHDEVEGLADRSRRRLQEP